MSVRINLGKWGSVFAVPNCIVDEHIKIASPEQLKVILFLLRNSEKSYTYKEIGDLLSIHQDDVKDSVDFWIERGVISKGDSELAPVSGEVTKSEKTTVKQKSQKHIPTRLTKPDLITAAQRVSADDVLQHLLSEIEVSLSKPLSSGDTSTIVMLYDACGLPAEVIVMLVNYCVSIGKGNMRTIERIGIKWADDGINSIEAADNKIMQTKQSNMNWSMVSGVFGLKNAGSPTAKQLEFADRWVGQWHFSEDMLRSAYELCVDNTGKMSLAYINKVLQRWYNAGIFITEDISKLDNKKKSKKTTSEASYNIEALEKIQ